MGAFEDRLAAGYRQAANTPAKMPQPTTPTEALAQALERTGIAADICDWWACDEAATSILAALPPGWRLCGPDDVTVTEAAAAYYNCQHDDDARCEHWRALGAALSADKEGQK